MSIIISDVSYHHPNQHPLFVHLNFSVEKQKKVSIVGNNGIGKSTLLKLMAGHLQPTAGNITATSDPCYIPQHSGLLHQSVAEALNINNKLLALDAIMQGSISQMDYDTLADDWEIESRCRVALFYWQLPHMELNTPMDRLSGGEKTKVFLAGLIIHTPHIILLDEPSNHLDATGRNLLYEYIGQSTATIVIVSHDVTLLNQLDATYELSEHGIRLYGGNYSFYKEQKETETNALNEDIHAEEKALRLARKKAQEVKERQEKRVAQGEKNKSQVVRIMKNTLRDSAEKTVAKLKDMHTEIIGNSQYKLSELRKQQSALKEMKVDFNNAALHSGKLLIDANKINLAYSVDNWLWKTPLDFKLYSNDRIHITGNNGTGKTSLIRLLTGLLAPSCGQVKQAGFSWIYLDQNYTRVDVDNTVEQLAEEYNTQNLKDYEIKSRLNRFLFSFDAWDKKCNKLSGGEKMRLYLCCLMISNQTPDLIILDEPTNNLDITSVQILLQTIKDYKGSLLVISHDHHFVSEAGVTGNLHLE